MSTKKFLCVLRADPTAPRKPPSPEEMQEAMARWHAWKAEFDAELFEAGAKLAPGGAVLRNGRVTDGPFVEGKEVLGGFMILQTTSLERAIEMVKKMPFQNDGAAIELREIATP